MKATIEVHFLLLLPAWNLFISAAGSREPFQKSGVAVGLPLDTPCPVLAPMPPSEDGASNYSGGGVPSLLIFIYLLEKYFLFAVHQKEAQMVSLLGL